MKTEHLIRLENDLNNGGFSAEYRSLACNEYEPVSYRIGYVVSITDAIITGATDIESHIDTAFNILKKLNIPDDHKVIGGWKDKDDKIYIDAYIYIYRLSDAVCIGKIFQQRAIWDIANNKEVYI